MLTDFLPTTKKEAELRGWDEMDVVLFSGDAYIDHPSFGAAVIGRLLESLGLRVAIVPQPDWHGDWRDFKKFGRPRLFFAISAGSMDSMVNHYTANRRRRSDDAYTPDAKAGLRPDYCTITYAKIIKQLYPETPLVIGGIEASMRRLTHYDYWSDKLMPSILIDSGADLLIYGMGEQPIRAIVEKLRELDEIQLSTFNSQLSTIPQTAHTTHEKPQQGIVLHSFEEQIHSKKAHAENFKIIEEQSNAYIKVPELNGSKSSKSPLESKHADFGTHGTSETMELSLIEPVGKLFVVVNPPFPQMTTEDLDASFSMPYQYKPHPKYKDKRIPAYDMIKFSVCMHRGCFGGCAFCTISAHQGKQVVSRSKESIMREIEKIARLSDFKGYLSDLGGPSANMYQMHGKDLKICEKCRRPSCLQPSICKNLNQDFAPLLDIYRSVSELPYIKKAFIGSGIRYDLMSEEYADEVIKHHVSGRLKVAPEHTSPRVLKIMRKPDFQHFEQFTKTFNRINKEANLKQQLIPYFISSHPGCTLEDMAELAVKTKQLNFQLEQIQDFTPTPMTLSTVMFYTGLDPYTLKPVFVAKTKEDKLEQRQFFFWYKNEYQQLIRKTLRKIHREDLTKQLLQR